MGNSGVGYRCWDEKFHKPLDRVEQGELELQCRTRKWKMMMMSEGTDVHKNQLLKQVPEQVWATGDFDIGLVKSVNPLEFKLKSGAKLPYQKQYPLSPAATEGIKNTIQGLLQAGVIQEVSESRCNTPIFPVLKADGVRWRMVQDLRPVNEAVEDWPADVPNPHTLLTNIPADAEVFSVIDMTQAFFSLPLAEQCKELFTFRYQGKIFVYNRLPQGFKLSPHIFNQALRNDLKHLRCRSSLLLYVDDLLIASPDVETYEKDTITVLRALAEGGHKVSRKKLQFAESQVTYLGRLISQGQKGIAPDQIQAIVTLPRPQTVRQMMAFIGLIGFSSEWVECHEQKIAPLRAMIANAGTGNLKNKLTWTIDGEEAFHRMKGELQQAPALALPDYTKPFCLYVNVKKEEGHDAYMAGILTQAQCTGKSKRAIAYYCTKLHPVAQGYPPCYQGLEAIYTAYEKASSVTMGWPVVIYTSHAVVQLTEQGRFLQMQENAAHWEKEMWKQRGAKQDHDKMWRNHKGLMVAPTNLLSLLISDAHDMDHCARGQIKRKIYNEGFWAPNLQDVIDRKIEQYHVCNRFNVKPGLAAKPLGHIPLPAGPFKHVVMDYIDMGKTIRKFRYVLVVVDRFSRWVEACPAPGPDAETVIKFFTREIIPRFGIPEVISSDNGKAFVEKTWKKIMQALGVKQRYGCIYHPQSQGMVERANGTLKAKIAKICTSSNLNWLDALPIALMHMRTQTNRSLNLSPHEILTGRSFPSPCYRGEDRGPPLELLQREIRQYVQQLSLVHKTVYAQALRRESLQGPADEVQRPIQPGDWLFVRVFKRSSLQPRREGPFQLTRATLTPTLHGEPGPGDLPPGEGPSGAGSGGTFVLLSSDPVAVSDGREPPASQHQPSRDLPTNHPWTSLQPLDSAFIHAHPELAPRLSWGSSPAPDPPAFPPAPGSSAAPDPPAFPPAPTSPPAPDPPAFPPAPASPPASDPPAFSPAPDPPVFYPWNLSRPWPPRLLPSPVPDPPTFSLAPGPPLVSDPPSVAPTSGSDSGLPLSFPFPPASPVLAFPRTPGYDTLDPSALSSPDFPTLSHLVPPASPSPVLPHPRTPGFSPSPSSSPSPRPLP
ncbi:hypothetical protein ACEWY4_007654 [Coilia grayii]|uniref:ribonuclease H n=1 Tax=Coilia grayii TaxID=363190 RepID=A0ABD1KHA1_9TELE